MVVEIIVAITPRHSVLMTLTLLPILSSLSTMPITALKLTSLLFVMALSDRSMLVTSFSIVLVDLSAAFHIFNHWSTGPGNQLDYSLTKCPKSHPPIKHYLGL